MSILEVQGLEAGYEDLQILWGIDLAVEPGTLTALVGTNGAGKTTLMRAITGQIKPRGGTVTFDGADVTDLPAYVKAERGLVMVPEGRHLFPTMTVLENLEMGATPKRARDHIDENFELVYELFPRLKDRLGQKAGTMSGGEQQMLAVARGIMSSPKVLMIDELSLGLAPVLVIDIFRALEKLLTTGITVLLVEQNVRLALGVSTYAYVVSEGRVEMSGPSSEIADDEGVRAAYLGI
jgi:branched-chain amino acid transport system ATP-binding protein